DRLEEAEVLQALLGLVDHQRIIGIALREPELAADYVVARAQVADDIDALDVDAGAFIDEIGDVDDVRAGLARRARAHAREGKALFGNDERQSLHRLVHQVLIVDAARAGHQLAAQRLGVDVGELGLNVDGAELEELPFVDHEGDEEAGAFAVELGAGRNDARVRIAVLHVVLAQQLFVEGEPVGIIDVGALQKVEQTRLAGGDDVAQLAVAEGAVAGEVDGLHLGGAALLDLEHQVYPIAVELDDLGLDGGGKSALPAVDVENALHVRLRPGAREYRAGLELHLVLERILVDLVIALKGHLIDD